MNDFLEKPPHSNRGVENTSEPPLRACVDWFQATFKFVQSEHEILDYFGLKKDSFVTNNSRLFGYTNHLQFGSISLLFNDNDDTRNMGYHIQFQGQGCREYEALNKLNWLEVFLLIHSKDANVTRLDLALDEFRYNNEKPFFTISSLIRKIKDGCCISKFHRGKRIIDFEIATGKDLGKTLYFGRDSSEIKIRFYDKLEERKAKNFEIEEGLTTWNRTEIQARNARALSIINHIIMEHDLSYVVRGVLHNYINFLVKGSDSNKSRWNIAKFWTNYIDSAEKLKLSLVAQDKTIERLENWFDKQVTPSLATLFTAYDGNERYIYEKILDGMSRMTEHQEHLAKLYSDKIEKEKQLLKYQKNIIYDRYLFLTGAGRENKKETAETVPNQLDD